jgi:hypothetical protein
MLNAFEGVAKQRLYLCWPKVSRVNTHHHLPHIHGRCIAAFIGGHFARLLNALSLFTAPAMPC